MELKEYHEIIISENIYRYGSTAIDKYLKNKKISIYNKRFLESEDQFNPIDGDMNFPMYYEVNLDNFIENNSIVILTDEDFHHLYKMMEKYKKLGRDYTIRERKNVIYVICNGKKTIVSNNIDDVISKIDYQETLNSNSLIEFISYSNAIIVLHLLMLETKKEMPKLIFNDMFDLEYLDN